MQTDRLRHLYPDACRATSDDNETALSDLQALLDKDHVVVPTWALACLLPLAGSDMVDDLRMELVHSVSNALICDVDDASVRRGGIRSLLNWASNGGWPGDQGKAQAAAIAELRRATGY